MKSDLTKTNQKKLIEKLAPAYMIIAIVVFAGVFLSNLDNFKNQQPLEIWSWFVAGIILALGVFVWVFNQQLEERVKSDVAAARNLRVARLILGGVFLVPVCLVAAGYDLSHAIGTYYVGHGYDEMVYAGKGVIPSAGHVYLATLILSVFLSAYFFILRQTRIVSTIGMLKLLLAIAIATPVTVILWGLDFSRYYQF